ncbi:hypothetical protein [Streptomyces turgidiscabies]|uniref:hypothetical protein n=1 Tax=Streptomyces turgidiscabies TaxID=85558 RepID=UPI0038F60674
MIDHPHSDPELRRQLAAAIRSLGTSETENAELRQRVATLEHVAAGNKRHVQLIIPDLERADAAIERIQQLLDTGQIGCCAHLIRTALAEPKDSTP